MEGHTSSFIVLVCVHSYTHIKAKYTICMYIELCVPYDTLDINNNTSTQENVTISDTQIIHRIAGSSKKKTAP